jgi:hypothetical protein
LTVGAFAASNVDVQTQDRGAMTKDSQNGEAMGSMTGDSQHGQAMGPMTNASPNSQNMNGMGHSKDIAPADHSWPILYGFGGFILVVIVIAGLLKFTALKGPGAN